MPTYTHTYSTHARSHSHTYTHTHTLTHTHLHTHTLTLTHTHTPIQLADRRPEVDSGQRGQSRDPHENREQTAPKGGATQADMRRARRLRTRRTGSGQT